MAQTRNVGVNVTATNNTAAGFNEVVSGAKVAGKKVGDAFKSGIDGTRQSFGFLNSALLGLGAGVALDKLRDIADAAARLQSVRISLNITFGDLNAGAAAFDRVVAASERFGLSLEAVGTGYSKFAAATRGTALEGAATERIFNAVTKASAALGLSADDTTGVLRALGQMASKGAIQMEELKGQLGERLPGALQMFAAANKITVAEVFKLAEAGKLGLDALIPFAAALEKQYGTGAQDAAKGLRAELNRLDNAWLQFKASLSDNAAAIGFIRFLQDAAKAAQTLVDALGGKKNTTAQLENQLEFLREMKKEGGFLSLGYEGFTSGFVNATEVQKRIAELEEILARRRRIAAANNRQFDDRTAVHVEPGTPDTSKEDAKRLAAAQKLADELDRINQSTMTKREKAITEVAQLNADLDRLVAAGLIDQETRYERLSERVKELLDLLNDAADKIKKTDAVIAEGNKKLREGTGRDYEYMTEYARQAARNMQDAFADFLFDPFDKGIKGMLIGFINVVRRMIAEALAADLLKKLMGDGGKESKGGWLGKLFGVLLGGGGGITKNGDGDKSGGGGIPDITKIFKETGGDVRAGSPYIVGEKRPELFIPRTSGTVVPSLAALSGGGDTNISISQYYSGMGLSKEETAVMISRANADLVKRISDAEVRNGRRPLR